MSLMTNHKYDVRVVQIPFRSEHLAMLINLVINLLNIYGIHANTEHRICRETALLVYTVKLFSSQRALF